MGVSCLFRWYVGQWGGRWSGKGAKRNPPGPGHLRKENLDTAMLSVKNISRKKLSGVSSAAKRLGE